MTASGALKRLDRIDGTRTGGGGGRDDGGIVCGTKDSKFPCESVNNCLLFLFELGVDITGSDWARESLGSRTLTDTGVVSHCGSRDVTDGWKLG